MKKNNNTVTLTEQEVHQLIGNIVNRTIKESMEESKFKDAVVGGMIGLGALGGCYSACHDDPVGDRNESDEQQRNAIEQIQREEEFNKAHPEADSETYDMSEMNELRQYNANRKYKLTESQLNQIVTEGVYNVLNEISTWQKMKSAGMSAIGMPWNWRKNYNKHNANYAATNATAAQGDVEQQIEAVMNKYQNAINNYKNYLQVWQTWKNNQLTKIKNGIGADGKVDPNSAMSRLNQGRAEYDTFIPNAGKNGSKGANGQMRKGLGNIGDANNGFNGGTRPDPTNPTKKISGRQFDFTDASGANRKLNNWDDLMNA